MSNNIRCVSVIDNINARRCCCLHRCPQTMQPSEPQAYTYELTLNYTVFMVFILYQSALLVTYTSSFIIVIILCSNSLILWFLITSALHLSFSPMNTCMHYIIHNAFHSPYSFPMSNFTTVFCCFHGAQISPLHEYGDDDK